MYCRCTPILIEVHMPEITSKDYPGGSCLGVCLTGYLFCNFSASKTESDRLEAKRTMAKQVVVAVNFEIEQVNTKKKPIF